MYISYPDRLLASRTWARGVVTHYAYDAWNQLVSTTYSDSTSGISQSDNFGYNSCSELTSATLGNDNYAYAFDHIGNRNTASEAGTQSAYSTNNLNQYTEISLGEASASPLQYDADGNATQVQTSTGTWAITYNGENRPIRFENAGTQTVVECGYDSQGRRFEKKVTVAGTTALHHRYIYRGYLQIAALDLTRAAHPALWLVTWDPSQPTATRPLAIQKDGTWFTYGYDITKNVCELFGPNGYIRTTYSYTPFGSVSASENGVVQNFQWSSEFYDSELDLVYYNYRHYSPSLGRFLSRDPIQEQGGLNLYAFVGNSPITGIDYLGKWLEGTHRQLTYDALSRIRLFVGVISLGKSLVIVSKLKDTLIEKIVDANVATDSGDYKNKQNYHYCADRDADWTVDYAKSVYSETLAQERKNFLEIISANQNDKESCLVALEYLGRLCHMWQDYYAHGVEKDDSWFGADIGTIKGNPNSPTMIPVSYGTLGFVGGHGGFFRLMNPFSNVEPGDRADDAETRRSQADRFTNKEAFPLLLEWFKSCKCVYPQM